MKGIIENMISQNRNLKNRRIKYAIAFLLLLAIEVIIAVYVHDKIIRPYLGDVLVVVVLYLGVRIFIPEGIKFLPLYIFLFATMVEVLQLFNLIQFFHIENNRFLQILIGSVFDVKDILCYGIGCLLLGAYEWKLK